MTTHDKPTPFHRDGYQCDGRYYRKTVTFPSGSGAKSTRIITLVRRADGTLLRVDRQRRYDK